MRLSRLAAAITAFTLFSSGAAAAAITISMFKDVPATHWAYEAIVWAAKTKMIKVTSSNMFKPEAPATRADLAYTSQQLYKNLNARLEALEAKTGISKSSSSASSVSQPEYKLVESRNAIRRSDVWSIINAIYQYSIDNNKLPAGITSSEKEICVVDAPNCTGLLKLDVLRGVYLVTIPRDPLATDPNRTGYTVTKDAQGHVTVKALYAENEAIRITR